LPSLALGALLSFLWSFSLRFLLKYLESM
jgi:hypothetical protein